MGNCGSQKAKGGAGQGPGVQQPGRPTKQEPSTPRQDPSARLEQAADDRQLNTDRPAHRAKAEDKIEGQAEVNVQKNTEERK